MAASFVSASSKTIWTASVPVSAYPFTLAAWAFPSTLSAQQSIYAIENPGSSSNLWALRKTAGNVWELFVNDGIGSSITAGTVTQDAWHFIVGRYISATNRRLSVINADGSISHAQVTISRTPTGTTRMNIGGRSIWTADFWNGLIGEIWCTNTDIQEGGAQLRDETLWQLAYGGPFSLPHIAKDIVEYRSLRKHPILDEMGEVYYGALGSRTWTNNNGVTIGPHPPLPYWYRNPADMSRSVIA